jgi:hypothetical protein
MGREWVRVSMVGSGDVKYVSTNSAILSRTGLVS